MTTGPRDQLARQLLDIAQDVGRLATEVKSLRDRLDTQPAPSEPSPDGQRRNDQRLADLADQITALRGIVQGVPDAEQFGAIVEELSEHIRALADRITGLEQSSDGSNSEQERSQVWDFTSLTGAAALAAQQQLTDWVTTVLGDWYGVVGAPTASQSVQRAKQFNGGQRIPECWPQHRDLIMELSWLCQEWLRVYRTADGTPARAGDWHDRWLPGLLRRLPSSSAGGCLDGSHRDPTALPPRAAPPRPAAMNGTGPRY